LVTLTMFWVRSRLLKASKRAAVQTGERLSQSRFGGGHGGGFLTAAGAGFASGGRRQRYIPYEVRSAYRDARQIPVNFREWKANTADRRAIRSGALPESMRPPARGFTASRRRRSAQRIGREVRAERRREGGRQPRQGQEKVKKSTNAPRPRPSGPTKTGPARSAPRVKAPAAATVPRSEPSGATKTGPARSAPGVKAPAAARPARPSPSGAQQAAKRRSAERAKAAGKASKEPPRGPGGR
jgi:hypothetical protein